MSQVTGCAQAVGPTPLPEWRVDFSDLQEAGSVCSLDVTICLNAEEDCQQLATELAELLSVLTQIDVAWGGEGLIIDREGCRTASGTLTLRLRPLDIRQSQDRFQRLIDLFTPPRPNSHATATKPALVTNCVAADDVNQLLLAVTQQDRTAAPPISTDPATRFAELARHGRICGLRLAT